jgi:hypothetical protein
MSNIILVAIVVFGVTFVVLAMMMVHEVSKRGVKINIIWLRLYVLKYMHQYRVLTKKESGKVGPLFYPCIASINLALILTVVYFFVL